VIGGLASASLIGAGLTISGNADSPPAEAAPPVVAANDPPITDPQLQQFLWKRDRVQVELNDALVALKDKKANPAACNRLNAALNRMDALGHAPVAKVDVLLRVGQDQFRQAATACLSGDLTAAYALVAQGLAARSPAYNELDDVLEGE